MERDEWNDHVDASPPTEIDSAPLLSPVPEARATVASARSKSAAPGAPGAPGGPRCSFVALLVVAFLSFAGFAAAEVVFALAARSLSMLGDAASMIVDACTYGLNLAAVLLSLIHI